MEYGSSSEVNESTTTDSLSVKAVKNRSTSPPDQPLHRVESRKLPSSRFRGVVPQPNGRWGAQIYDKHSRVWLGTFGDEQDAARAYDTAVLRFRGRDAATNFREPAAADFLFSHSKVEIVDMLRKHTYGDELDKHRRWLHHCGQHPAIDCRRPTGIHCRRGERSARQHLFEKLLTPSDVGKLNRLVIPKQLAERHLPLPPEAGNSMNGVLLSLEELNGRVWRFRYSYWNSSQSYTLTKGWSRFVKEKNLRAGDVVSLGRTDERLCIEWENRGDMPVPVMRLFGVDIFEDPGAGGKRVAGWRYGGSGIGCEGSTSAYSTSTKRYRGQQHRYRQKASPAQGGVEDSNTNIGRKFQSLENNSR